MAFHLAAKRWCIISRSWFSPQLITFLKTTRFHSELVESSRLPLNDYGYATETRHPPPLPERRRWNPATFLSKETIGLISSRQKEPDWMLEFRIKAHEEFLKMEEPPSLEDTFPEINFIDMFTELEKKANLNCSSSTRDSYDVFATYPPWTATTLRTALDMGVIVCPISEAIRKYPDLVKQYLGRVVPPGDNFFAALNSAVFTHGTFVYVPKNVKCLVPITPPVMIRSDNSSRARESTFGRTLIVADRGSFVKYFGGLRVASAHISKHLQPPESTDTRLHAAVVELYCHECAEMEHWSQQDWCCYEKDGSSKTLSSNVFSFDTEKGFCEGSKSKICWSQAETATSTITFEFAGLAKPKMIQRDMIVDGWDDS